MRLESTWQLGWFVGWIEKDTQTYPFAFVLQDTTIIPSQRIVRVKQLLHDHLPATTAACL